MMKASPMDASPRSPRVETDASMPSLAGTAAAIRLDAKGRISDATASAAAMLGFEPQELRGRTLKDLALEGWQAAADMAAARVRFGATESFELALKGRSGRRTLVEMTAQAGTDEGSGAVVSWSERRIRRSSRSEAETDPQRIAYGLLRTHEAERMRLAIELHDELAPVVVMAKYLVEDAMGRIGTDAPEELARTLNDAAGRLRGVIAELHRISSDLRPRVLDDLGLFPALEWLGRSMEQASRGLRVECRFSVAESEVPDELKLEIFRIAQAALNNVVEHANASHAAVCLYATPDELCVVVEDDGHGFDPDAVGPSVAGSDRYLPLGLTSIRKRVEATGGRLLLESQGMRGTRIGGAWRLASRGA